jgi:hypothetical protein
MRPPGLLALPERFCQAEFPAVLHREKDGTLEKPLPADRF